MRRLPAIVAWVVLTMAVAVSFAIDWANTTQGGAIDLRNRITGVRLLEHGIDPYRFKWHPADLPIFCDPTDNPNGPVSRTTATPALLLLHAPLAALPYRSAQLGWLVCQWLMLLGTAWLWLRGERRPGMKWLVALVVVGFSFTSAWRLHAERGQCYVLLLFVFASWLTTMLNARRSNGFFAGCLAGLLVALRPPFILILPFVALHRRGQIRGAATGLLLGFGLPMLVRPSCWGEYWLQTQAFSSLFRNGVRLPPGDMVFPPVIEGMPLDLINHSLYLPTAMFSLHSFLLQHGLEPFPAWPPLLALGLAFLLWLEFSHRQPAERLLPGLAAWLFLADIALPIYRESYNDVLILNAVAAGLVVAPRIPWAAGPTFAAVVLGTVVSVRNLDHPWVILPSILFTLTAILFLLPPFGKRNERSNDAAI